MIEKFFFKGAQFSWNPPPAIANAPQDGTIVPSPVTASNLVFEDLHPTMYDVTQINKFRNLGIMKNQAVAHDWLCYIHGRTATLNTHNDVLTGFMSGCFIGVWNDANGLRQVGHIGTVESAPKNAPPNSTVKATFLGAPKTNVKAYNPAAAWDPAEVLQIGTGFKNPSSAGWTKVVSLVTGTNQFYSILLMKHKWDDAKIVCGGIKLCTGMGPGLLQTALA